MTKAEVADKAMRAYDEYIFSSFGRGIDEAKADALALYATHACAAAARDRSVNQYTRSYYARLRDQFSRIAA